MAGTQQTINSQVQIDQNQAADIMFRMRCAIPAIVQSYNASKNTIEAQPAIRERLVLEDGSIRYINLPLLINVPVAFPSSGAASITFPISPGDECLIIFSDLAIDNFWVSGSIQNPIEVRRHDLSDGIAIPCSLSLTRTRGAGKGMAIQGSPVTIKSSQASVEVAATTIKLTQGDTSATLDGTSTVFSAGTTSITMNNAGINFAFQGKIFTAQEIYDKIHENG